MKPILRIHHQATAWLFLVLAICLPLCLVVAAPPAWAEDETAPVPVEVLYWSRHYTGQVAGKGVQVWLERVGSQVQGSYCYMPCRQATRDRLQLKGGVQANASLALTERELATATRPDRDSGQWRLRPQGAGWLGEWHSSGGGPGFAVQLRGDEPGHPFPYEIRLLASAQPGNTEDCYDPPYVSALRLYDRGRLVQELATGSQGTCTLFVPQTADINFDGWPDLMLAQTLPAGPNIPYNYWIYNPRTRLLENAPEGLQEVTSPQFDYANRVIWTGWRASCCEHGITTWRWKGGQLVEEDTQSSYVLPVLVGKTRHWCYSVPGYERGHIVYPDRVEQGQDGKLRLTFSNLKGCDDALQQLPDRAAIEVWKRNPATHGLDMVRRELPDWKPVNTPQGQRWCREVPFFTNGQIRRIVLNDDPDNCEAENPNAPNQAR